MLLQKLQMSQMKNREIPGNKGKGMNRMNRNLALSIIIIITAGFLGLIPVESWAIDAEFMKNGEVFIMLTEADASKVNKPGVYKLSEYYMDSSGNRQPLVAKEADLPNVFVTKAGWDGKFEGIAVSKERTCYSFKEKRAENYVNPTSIVYSPIQDVAISRTGGSGRSGWYGSCGNGTPGNYFGGCAAAHTNMGHQMGNYVWWRGQGIGGNDKFYVGKDFKPDIKFDTTGDKVTNIGIGYAVWPCTMHYHSWSGDPWPRPEGPTTKRTINGVVREISNSGKYRMPSGVWFHDASDRKHTYFNGAGMMKMMAAAVKYRDLYMHQWIPSPPYKDWQTSGKQIQKYSHEIGNEVVFQTFDAKWHVFRATPCGDGCLPGKAAKEVLPAGSSKISITITPFGRSYGLQVINDTATKYAVIRRVDPIYNSAMKVIGTKKPVEYQPGDENKATTTAKPRLDLVTLGTVDSDWLNAVSIGTSYKFSNSEVFMDFNTKSEFVYISNSPLFAVSDTWFGTGGRAYMGFQDGNKVNVTSQERNETTRSTANKKFTVKGIVQDFGADGYGNFFYLTTTDKDVVKDFLDREIKGDWNKMLGKLKVQYTGGKPVTDTGWKTVAGDTLRTISFEMDVYKEVWKISSSVIDEKGVAGGTLPELGDRSDSVNGPQNVGRIKQASMSVTRTAKKIGAVVSWLGNLSTTDGIDWSAKTAEIAIINIAAPPEVQGVNYYIDIKGNSNAKPSDAGSTAALFTDVVYEGENGEWRIENPPVFNEHGLNKVTGLGNNDENGNGIIGGLRNNIIEPSLAFRWKIYRVFDVEEMYFPPYENNTTSKGVVGYDPEKTGGKYRQNLIDEFWQVVDTKDSDGNYITDIYQRKLDSKTIQANSTWLSSLGVPVKHVAQPWKLNYKFPEAGIYKVSLHIEFNLYDYGSMKFGENAGGRDGYKLSHWELNDPVWNTSDPDKQGRPVFKNFDDLRFVLVTSRGVSADGDYLKGVTVSVLESGTRNEAADIEVDEVNRWQLFKPVLGSYLSSNKGKPFGQTEIEALQDKVITDWGNKDAANINFFRMEKKGIIGEFAIKWISAFPQRGEKYKELTANEDDSEKFEKCNGIGVFDYSPDYNYDYKSKTGHDENSKSDPFTTTAGVNPLCAATDTRHPQNASQPNKDLILIDRAKTADAKIYRFRNLGMHGYGTLARSLSKWKLDELQKNLDPKDEPWRINWIPVNASQWNGNVGDDNEGDRGYPIREIDWDYVRYQWYIAYEINGEVKVETPGEYSGSIREVLQWCFNNEDRALPNARKDIRAFIKVLNGSDLPSDKPNLFGDGLDHVKERIPVFHVRFPMLERTVEKGKTVFRSVRWETPIGPRKYHIGLKITAPRLTWRKHSSDVHTSAVSGGPERKDKNVYWDLVVDSSKKEDIAWCGPNTDNIKGNESIVSSGVGVFAPGRDHVKVFVRDNEPPSFGVLGAGSLEAMLTYPGATTGDKYHKPLRFTIIDNNPNFNPALYVANTCDLKFSFPAWSNPEMQKRKAEFGSSASELPELGYIFSPPIFKILDEKENAFQVTPIKGKENWGAPYSLFVFELPVMKSVAFDSKDLRNGVSEPTSTPYMPPDHVGDLYYGLEVNLSYEEKGGSPQAKKLDPELYNESRKAFKFNVSDNDSPNLIVEVQTSFTEKTRFAAAATDLAYEFKNFDDPKVYLSNFSTALKRTSPDGWPDGIRDANAAANSTGTTSIEFGPTEIRVLDVNEGDPKRLPGAIGKDKDLIVIDVDEIKSLDPKYMIYIPENSRAVFRIQAFDNVPVDNSKLPGGSKSNLLLLDATESKCLAAEEKDSGNFWVTAESPGEASSAGKGSFIKELRASVDPINPAIINLFGTFRTPTTEKNHATIKIKIQDDTGNKRVIHLPIRVVDTFIKQDRLDLEKERRD